MEIIVPAAGLSTRFPNMKPKYLLKDENGEMMIKKALKPYLNYSIKIGILYDHYKQYDAMQELKNEFGDDIEIIVLPRVTKGPADTVYQIIESTELDYKVPFLIKDCDSFFNHKILDGNYVAITQVADHDVLINLGAKSFVVTNEQGIINDIVEKKVVSDKFCVGGYKFNSVELFTETFERISGHVGEIFVSHVIQDCLMNGHIFFENIVTDYYDVGTAQDWKVYNESITR